MTSISEIYPRVSALARAYNLDPLHLAESIDIEAMQPAEIDLSDDAPEEVREAAVELGVPAYALVQALELAEYYKCA